MGIHAYVRDVSFDDATLRTMGEEFDRACVTLGTFGISLIVREMIAIRIIEAAKTGERNPIRLYEYGIAALDGDNKQSRRLVA